MWLQELLCYPARAGFPELPPGPWLKVQKTDVVEILEPKRHDLKAAQHEDQLELVRQLDNKPQSKQADRPRAR